MRKFVLLTSSIVFVLLILPSAFAQTNTGRPLVNTIVIDGAIDPAMAIYVHRSIDLADRNGAQALIVLLDTPGGLMNSMDSIMKDFLASRVPIVVYVWPKGARAASAGAFITMASNVAVMSPATNIGASHPVSSGGEMDPVMSKKVENDAAASARKIALERGRNVQIAEEFVRESISITAEEAKKKNVIDFIANDQSDLLKQLDGRKVKTTAGDMIIRSADAQVRPIPLSLREQFLHLIDNPNITYILMLIAIYGIIAELNNPGSIFPGVVGSIALLMALFSFSVLPVNTTGVLLVVLGIGLLVIDLFVTSHGVLTVGGIAAFAIGSLLLFETRSPVFRISVTLVLTMTILTAGFFLFAIRAGIRAQKNRVVTGAESLVGMIGEARTDIAPKGKVFVDGTWWTAVTSGESIKAGDAVRILGMCGLVLTVEKHGDKCDEGAQARG